MSTVFGSLYYTDCLPGQGLRGGAGFQFQAVSRDVSHDMMTLTQRSTLYEAPVSWMREHRPAAEYPPSLTHVFDGCYVTARGVYLGAEANGVREGNQFTHAVATDDAETYGMVRPAQLWDAPWWSERPAPTTECEPVAAEPETGPWGIDAVREWILGQPDGEEWLTAVYSAVDRVHDDVRQRVLFVATDPSAVLCWLTAATLLLPQARAVRVTFRVYAANPQYSEHDVLALHPDWAGSFASARGDGEFVVFNLDTGARSEVEPTGAALRWVPRFLRNDPYDVIDAVELAHQFAGGTRASTSDLLASCAVLLHEPGADRQECATLTEWLAARPMPAADDVVPAVVDAVLAGPVDPPTLRALDAAVHWHQPGGPDALRVRRVLFDAELAALTSGETADLGTGPLPPIRWADAEVTARIERRAEDIAPELMALLLRTAQRFGVTPRVAMFRDGVHRFTRWWADNPEAVVEPHSLHCGAELVDLLRDELAHRLQTGHSDNTADRTASNIYHHWWPLLHPTISDATTPLDAAIAAATVAKGASELRVRVLETVMGHMVFAGGHNVVDKAWTASFRYYVPNVAELGWFLTSLPPGPVPPALADRMYGIAGKSVRTKVCADVLDVLEQLVQRGASPPSGRLATLTEQCLIVRQWCGTISSTKQGADSPATKDLRKVSATVLEGRASKIVTALLAGTGLANATRAAEHGGGELQGLLAKHLPEVWANEQADNQQRNAAVALAYLTASADTCADVTSVRLTGALRNWVSSNGSRHLDVEKLLGGLNKEYAEQWRGDLIAGKGQLRVSKSTKDEKRTEKPSRWRLGSRRGKE